MLYIWGTECRLLNEPCAKDGRRLGVAADAEMGVFRVSSGAMVCIVGKEARLSLLDESAELLCD